MTAAVPHEPEPIPALPLDATPQAIRAALVAEERAAFDRDYQAALARAGKMLDLNGVLDVLNNWRHVAWITQRHGAQAHQRILNAAARLTAGEDVPTVPGHVIKAEVNHRLER